MNDKEKLIYLRQLAKGVKMFATDLDGTLFDSRHQLSDENLGALQALAEKGIVLVVATGRSRLSIPDSFTSIKDIKYLITANGARIHLNSTDEIIREEFVLPAALEFVMPLLRDPEIMCEVFWNGVPHVDETRYKIAAEYGIPRWFSDYFYSTRKPIADLEAAIFENENIIENINFVFGSEEVQERVRLFLEPRTDLYEFTSSFPFNYEIGGIGVSKGAAMDFIAELEGIAPEEIISFGDNDNDRTMLEHAGIGVATANAVDSVKAAADLVTEQDNNESCVAAALKLLEII